MLNFLSPSFLFALLLLPFIWLFLKATPPLPKQQPFPSLIFLHNLHSTLKDSTKIPWWLFFFRLLIIALFILGLAQPIFVPSTTSSSTSSNRPILLILDNGWASASSWQYIVKQASQILKQATQQHQKVQLVLTAPNKEGGPPHQGPMTTPSIISAQLAELHPSAWPVERKKIANLLQKMQQSEHYGKIYYFSDGIYTDQDLFFANTLKSMNPVYEIRPPDNTDQFLLRKTISTHSGFRQPIEAIPAKNPRKITLKALTFKGETLASVTMTLPAYARSMIIDMPLPLEIRNAVNYLQLANTIGPARVALLDQHSQRHPVGLISSTENANTPFVGSLYYLKNALSPTYEIREGNIPQILSRPVSIILTPDGNLSNPVQQNLIEDWVKKGGMLVRFSGPLLAASNLKEQDASLAPQLLPLPLLKGARELGGLMTWEKPQQLAPFPANSPFHGLTIPQDIKVTRQVLIQPSPDLMQYCWARLQDGTPLVTHHPLGMGQLVLFHVSSNPDWSSLPLSGLFVSMLDRLVESSAGVITPSSKTLTLPPMMVLNGEGLLEQPYASVQNLKTTDAQTITISFQHPPGLYGTSTYYHALNLGDVLPPLTPSSPFGQLISTDLITTDHPLGGFLIVLSILLVLIDILISLILQGRFRAIHKKALTLGIGILLFSYSNTQAIAADQVPKAALETRLGYILTGHSSIDLASKQGLEGLSHYVNAKTSAKLAPPDGVSATKNDLSYYPLLYWPITADIPIDPQRTIALNNYIAHGGILLLDTQGHDSFSNTQPQYPNHFTGNAPGTANALKRATQGLNIPTLSILSDQYLLSRTFFILHEFPGRYNAMPVWISQPDYLTNDGVSSIIIGENDWAHAWATDEAGENLYATIPNDPNQRQLAYRFGVNLVIYSLTGSYKSDQIHVSTLLNRMKQQ